MDGIKLRLSALEPANHLHLHGFRIRIEAYDAPADLTPYVFIANRHPANPYTGEVFDEFFTVVSFANVEQYPVGSPDMARSGPFFRTDAIELDVPSTQAADEIWKLIQEQVCSFQLSRRKATDLELVATFWVGDEPADVSGSL